MSTVCVAEASPVRYRRRRQVSSCDFHQTCPSICRSSIEARILGCKWAGCTFFPRNDGLNEVDSSHAGQMWKDASQMLWHTSQVEHVVANLNRSREIGAILDVPFEVQVRIEKWVHEKNRVESRYGAYRWSVVNVEKERRSVISAEGHSEDSEQISVIIARSTRRKDNVTGNTNSETDSEHAEYAITASGREKDGKLGNVATHALDKTVPSMPLDAESPSGKAEATGIQLSTEETADGISGISKSTLNVRIEAAVPRNHDGAELIQSGVDFAAPVSQVVPAPILPEIRPLPQLELPDTRRILDSIARGHMDDGPPRTLFGQTSSRAERSRRDMRRYSYPYPSPTPDLPQSAAACSISFLQEQHQQQTVEITNNSHALTSGVLANPVGTSLSPAQNHHFHVRIPCFWSSDVRISLTRALSATSSSPFSCFCLSMSTRCDTFVLLYVLAALVSLISSILYTTITHDTSGGFTVGAYMVALASLVIMPLQSRHLRRCKCASSSNQVVGDHSDELMLASLNGVRNVEGEIYDAYATGQPRGTFEMRAPTIATDDRR